MEREILIERMDRILTKAGRIGALSDILCHINLSDDKSQEEADRFTAHITEIITELSAEIVAIVHEVEFPEVFAAHKGRKR